MSDMYEPRPSAPDWQTRVLPTVPTIDEREAVARRRRLIVLGSAGAFLALAIGYWALSGPGDDKSAPAAAPATSAQVLQTTSIEPLIESSTGPSPKPSSARPSSRPPAVSAAQLTRVLQQMRGEVFVLFRSRQLERDDARALNTRLRKIAEELRKDDREGAGKQLKSFAKKLADLHDDGKISDAGFTALAGQAAQLSTQLPVS
ncbi:MULTISPECIES: hypothetical protein [unclassified Actinoplanes]|uniref:FIMAH domain-containing protein n=1 Tax=unclassified Actinoplanes TaxID=2626549 RepID=UPI0005BB614F|nr:MULTISPECIES: hypothetical protein [unclassified Actinoplanes]SLL97914.1 hypothetical protein ACSP50_1130 [Actinoplanes sp. SE50/110]